MIAQRQTRSGGSIKMRVSAATAYCNKAIYSHVQAEKHLRRIHIAAHFAACFYSTPRLYSITSKSCVSLKLTIIFIISPSLSFWSVSSLCPGLW